MAESTRKSKPVYLYCHPSMVTLSKAIEKQSCGETGSGSTDQLRRITFHDDIRWQTFPDGFPNLFLDHVHNLAGNDVIFLGSFHSPAVIFEQLSMIFSIPRYLTRSFCFVLPYFPTGTMERVETEGQIATASILAKILSGIPLIAPRVPAEIIIFDIHALQERFYFLDNVIPRLLSAVPLLIKAVTKLPERDQVMYAFPDEGAFKRFSRFFTKKDFVVCDKIREGNKKLVTIKSGNPDGKHLIMVDDLVQTGGTLIECAKVLRERGALSVSAYATHAVFPNLSWKLFTQANENRFKNFWVTDSIPHAPEICQHEPFRLLSLAEIIADNFVGYDLET